MLVIDEYLAVDVTLGDWPAGLPDDEALLLPASPLPAPAANSPAIGRPAHDQSGSAPRGGSPCAAQPAPQGSPDPRPRPLLDEAARIGARYSTGGLLVCETLAAGLLNGRQLWFGTARNVGRRLAEIADDLDITIHTAEPASDTRPSHPGPSSRPGTLTYRLTAALSRTGVLSRHVVPDESFPPDTRTCGPTAGQVESAPTWPCPPSWDTAGPCFEHDTNPNPGRPPDRSQDRSRPDDEGGGSPR